MARVENLAVIAGFVWLASQGHWAMAALLLVMANPLGDEQLGLPG